MQKTLPVLKSAGFFDSLIIMSINVFQNILPQALHNMVLKIFLADVLHTPVEIFAEIFNRFVGFNAQVELVIGKQAIRLRVQIGKDAVCLDTHV